MQCTEGHQTLSKLSMEVTSVSFHFVPHFYSGYYNLLKQMPLECLELSQPVSSLHPFESYALSFNNSLVAITETWLTICEITPSCAGSCSKDRIFRGGGMLFAINYRYIR